LVSPTICRTLAATNAPLSCRRGADETSGDELHPILAFVLAA
jgi:hypothetical protein